MSARRSRIAGTCDTTDVWMGGGGAASGERFLHRRHGEPTHAMIVSHRSCTPASASPDLLRELLNLLVGAAAGRHEALDLLDPVLDGRVVAIEVIADLD